MSEKRKATHEERKQRITAHIENSKKKVSELKTKIKSSVNKKNVKPTNSNTVTQNRLKLLVTIVNRNKSEYYMDLIQSFDVNLQFLTLARGTANEEMLGILGLTETDKVVIFSVIQESKVPDALHALEEKFNTIKNGKGIAYTIPLSSVIGTLIYGFLSNNRMAIKESK